MDANGDPERVTLRSPSALLLVTANLIPLGGVLYAGWSIREVMLLFWLESAVIGVFNVLKMLRTGGLGALPLSAFFSVHYGGFMAGHLVFIFGMLLDNTGEMNLPEPRFLLAELRAFWPGILALCISHGFSFASNFLGLREYLRTDVNRLMFEPYKRIFVMHATILLGGFLAQTFASTLWPLVLLIVLKIGLDLHSHLQAHRRAARGPGQQQ